MKGYTLQEAKAKLNQLVELAQQGEDVVLFRGSEIVARIQPISALDVEVAPRLTDAQAERFWEEIEEEEAQNFSSAKKAVARLRRIAKSKT